MIRFVAIGNLRGAYKRPRVLDSESQELAIASYERESTLGEIVIWRGAEARVAPRGYAPQRSELKPRVSAELRRQITGPELSMIDEIKLSKARRRMMR